ncbi:hypothetical protein EMIT079MI2_150042 [Bacillus sp. IT-79MI2]
MEIIKNIVFLFIIYKNTYENLTKKKSRNRLQNNTICNPNHVSI